MNTNTTEYAVHGTGSKRGRLNRHPLGNTLPGLLTLAALLAHPLPLALHPISLSLLVPWPEGLQGADQWR